MTDETLRWRGGWARLSPWRGRADVAYLPVGAERPPTPEIVERCLRMMRGRGYSAVVTSALAAADALPFLDAGFSVREQLHLLAHAMTGLPEPARPTRRAKKSDRRPVLELDHLSFDGFWRLDANGLTNAIEATPASRFRVAESKHDLLAYAVTGRAGQHGYIQRLAVHPDVRRAGYGRAIVLDGLRWLRRHGATQALVNTQRDNTPALALYESCGFRELPSGLCVMGRSL